MHHCLRVYQIAPLTVVYRMMNCDDSMMNCDEWIALSMKRENLNRQQCQHHPLQNLPNHVNHVKLLTSKQLVKELWWRTASQVVLPKIALSPGWSEPHLYYITWLGTPESMPQTGSWSVQPFYHTSWLCPHTQTMEADETLLTVGHMFAFCACDAA